jgi:hypothetical protein
MYIQHNTGVFTQSQLPSKGKEFHIVDLHVTANNINTESTVMETQQCIIFSTLFKEQNISYCLYLLSYPNSLLLFGLRRLILCHCQQRETHLGLLLPNFNQI